MDIDKLTQTIKRTLKCKLITENIPPDEIYDIIQNSVVDVLEHLKNKLNKQDFGLEFLESVIDQNIKKYINQVISPHGAIDCISDDWDFGSSVGSLRARLINDEELPDEKYGRLYDAPPEFKYDDSIILIYDEEDKLSKNTHLHSDLIEINTELINFLKRNPRLLYELNPIKFEELVAELLNDMGYAIELTKKTRDGGVDIFATQKTGIGESLLVVDCKRYAPHKHIGVGVVRSLYGVTEQLNATMGIVATTSFFSKPAIEFKDQLKYKISLKDYNDIIDWLLNYKLLKK